MFEIDGVGGAAGVLDHSRLDEHPYGYDWDDHGNCSGDGDGDHGGGGAPEIALSTMAASAGLAMELQFGLAPAQLLDDAALLEVIRSFGRVAAWAQANQSRMIAQFDQRRGGDHPVDAGQAVDELAVELRWSTGTAAIALRRAAALDGHLTETRQAWEQGLLDDRRVAAIVDATTNLTDEIAVRVQDRVLPRAPHQTLAQLKAALQKAIIAADPQGARERHERAAAERGVALYPEPDAMAVLSATLPAPDAVGCYESLTRLARGLGGHDPRGMDARRADLLVGLVTGRIIAGTPIHTNTDTTPDTGPDAGPDAATAARTAGPADGAGIADTADADSTADASSVAGAAADEDVQAPHGRPADVPDVPDVPAEPGEPGEAMPARWSGAADADLSTEPASAIAPTATPAPQPTPIPQPAPASSSALVAIGGDVQVVRPVTPARPLIHVTLDLDTLTGAAEHPAQLTGYGPIPASTARAIAAGGIWQRLVTDPLSGTLLDHGRTRYTPPEALADHVRARDQRCMFPGCRRAAINCELDHTLRYPDGPTSATNLAPLCARHHKVKHAGDWHVSALPDGGLAWRTPTGAIHHVYPHDYRPPTTAPDPPQPPPPDDEPPF